MSVSWQPKDYAEAYASTRRVLLDAVGDRTGILCEARAVVAERDHYRAETERLRAALELARYALREHEGEAG